MFIAFEGGEGAGKSTQAARLALRIDALLTREPGGTAIGEQVRELVLARAHDIAPRAEALLMAAARAQHVADVIAPALAAGRHVVTDRFTGSSLAYQGHARGLGVAEVAALSAFAVDGCTPDVTVLLDVSESVAARRRAGRRADRIESEGELFHRRVADGYRSLAATDPTWVVVDGGGDLDEVELVVWDALRAKTGIVEHGG